MRAQSDVYSRLRRLLEAEVSNRLSRSLDRLPENCKHNYRQPLDVRPILLGRKNPNYNRISNIDQTLGLCMLGSEDSSRWEGTICEDPIDAQKCPYYTKRKSYEEVLRELSTDLKNPEWLKDRQDLQTLAWVLAKSPKKPWYIRLWHYLIRGNGVSNVVEVTLVSLLEATNRGDYEDFNPRESINTSTTSS